MSLPSHSCRPRCCDFCEKRGTEKRPLERWFVRIGCDDPTAERLTGGNVLALWLHNHCSLEVVIHGDNATEAFQLR